MKKLYKELMIMGFVSFGSFMAFNAVTVLQHNEQYYAFEFAHITIFFLALFLVIRALFVMYNSNNAITSFWRAHSTSNSILLEHLLPLKDNFWRHIIFKYFHLFSQIRCDIEHKYNELYPTSILI